MKFMKVMIVRIYITEASKLLKPIIDYLHREKVRGVSVFRAISGYGETGVHDASFVDLSLNLPLTVEFFDEPERAKIVIEGLANIVRPEHIIFWDVYAAV